MSQELDTAVEALADNLTTLNPMGDDFNVADGLLYLGQEAKKIADAIAPASALPGHDAAGGRVDSLTEAVMGVTAGLCRIADAIEALATAVRGR